MSRHAPKTMRYIHAIHWIADNDAPKLVDIDEDLEKVKKQWCVRLLAEISGRAKGEVAMDVLKYRATRHQRKKKAPKK